jgi:anti-sigma B factor antagonist
MLQIEQERIEPDIELVRLAGEIVLGPASQQVEMLIARLIVEGRTKVVLDMSGLTHIDSTAVGVIVRSLGLVRGAGGELRLASLPPRVLEVLHTTKLDRVIRLYPDAASAAQDFEPISPPSRTVR